jgi:hypothetical protein
MFKCKLAQVAGMLAEQQRAFSASTVIWVSFICHVFLGYGF